MIFLDTHVLVWLYEGFMRNIPENIQHKLETMPLFISPMVQLELNFLYEIKRLTVTSLDIIRYLNIHLGLTTSKVDFHQIIEEAQQHTWTRDPFDRLIVANASKFESPLITKDELILKHYPLAIWK
jgi:PIN domain nuclease of toxin-antitoxin system